MRHTIHDPVRGGGEPGRARPGEGSLIGANDLSLYALAAIAGFALSAGLVPVLARVARSLDIVAAPRPDRWGSRSTPLLGGVAITVGSLTPVAVLTQGEGTFLPIAAATLGAFTLGLIDDVRGLRPTSKLVGQIVIASGLAFAGIRVEIIGFAPLAFLVTLFWIVAMMNAVNLIDNMDGLAAGVCAIAGAVLFLLAPVDPLWIRVVAASLAGACIGFLVHNFPPARIYMGDAGSLGLGCALGSIGLILTNTAASNVGLAVLGPLLALGLPIFDTTLVTLVRRIEGRPISQGSRDHTSHRLAALGLTERETVVVLYVITAGLAAVGLASSALGFAAFPLVALVVVGLILFGSFLAEVAPAARSPVLRRTTEGRVIDSARTFVRFGGEIALDVTLATVALFTAFLIRFEQLPLEAWMPLFADAAPILIPIQLATLLVLGMYRVLWRFLSITDVVVMGRAVLLGTLLGALVIFFPLRMLEQSRAVFVLDAVLLVALLVASRSFAIWLRRSFALRSRTGDRRVIIVGATESGEIALRMLLLSTQATYRPAGFLDDDPAKMRRRISGVPVIGRVADLEEAIRREQADVVVLANDGDEEEAAAVRQECARLGVELREFHPSL